MSTKIIWANILRNLSNMSIQRVMIMMRCVVFCMTVIVISCSHINSDQVVDERKKALDFIVTHLDGRYQFDPDVPGKSVLFVSLGSLGIDGAGMKCLSELPELRGLSIKHIHEAIDPYLIYLKNLPNIEELHLDGSLFGDAGSVHLETLAELKILTMGRTNITDEGMRNLSGLMKLEKLELGGCKNVTDSGLSSMKGLTKLQILSLHETGVSSTGISHLENLTDMRTLDLPDGMTDESCYYLRKMERLYSLDLPNSTITSRGAQYLSQLNRLRILRLMDSKIDHDALKIIGQMKRLESLNLEGATVTDADVEALTGLQSLTSLSLDNTSITSDCFRSMVKLKSLKDFSASYTKFSIGSMRSLENRIPGLNQFRTD